MYLILLGYSVPIVVCFFAWDRAKKRVKVFQAAWVWGIMFMLNAYGILYYIAFDVSSMPLGISLEKYMRGSYLNLVFLLTWSLGYFLGVYKDIKISKKSKYKDSVRLTSLYSLRVLLLVSGLSTLFYYTMGVSYGETVFDYSSLPVYFGVVGAFRSLFLPAVATYLIITEKFEKRSLVLERFLWSLIIIRAVAGVALDMQRGDVVYPFLVAVLILVYKGYIRSRNKILSSVATVGIVIIMISPILDILRSPGLYNKEIGVENVVDAVNRVSESTGEGVFSVSTLMYVPYTKSILPSSSYSLLKKSSEDGHIYFTTYDDVFVDMIPRFIWPNKPWPLSVNGERTGMAAGVAANNLGMNNILWVMGGGTMYWQFGWTGVLLGGLVVGLVWGLMTQKMLFSSSPFLVIIYISLIGWGINFVSSIDKLMLDVLREVRALLLIWIPIVVMVYAAKK